MRRITRVTRRRALALALAGSATAVLGTHAALAEPKRRTPGQILGPYFPVNQTADADADLTQMAGRPQRAEGQVVRLSGRLLDERGRAVARARMIVWQANAHGRYAHSSDGNPAPLDPNFQGSALLETGANGEWSILTIKPAPYHDDGANWVRAPHIHFDVTGRVNRLVTQMYFEGESLNDTDRVLAFAGGSRSRLIVPFVAGADGAIHGAWDIVLRDG